MHVAIIHDCLPWPTINGANARVASLAACLHRKGVKITFVAGSRRQLPVRRIESPYLHKIAIYYPPGIFNALRRTKRKIDYQLEQLNLPTLDGFFLKILGKEYSPTKTDHWRIYPEGLDEFVLRLHQEDQFDAIFVEYIWMHKSVSLVRGQVPVVLDIHDLMHSRASEFQRNGKVWPLTITEQQEIEILDTFDATLVLQEKEAAAIEGRVKRTVVLRTGIDSYDPLPMPRAESALNILYIGGDSQCNVDGITWFLNEVWPAYSKMQPLANLIIAGQVAGLLKLTDAVSLRQIKTVGFVKDLKELYSQASICINPINFGSGLKIKTVEALGRARPLITTTVGIEGIKPSPENACIIASTAADWIKSLNDLSSNPNMRERYATAAEAYARDWLTQDSIFKEVSNWLDALNRRRYSPLSA